MSKLTFFHSVMDAGKSTALLQMNFNMVQHGRKTFLITPESDKRYGEGKITSKIGIDADAHTLRSEESLFDVVCQANSVEGPISAVFIDEAQFFTQEQVWDMARIADELEIPVNAFGLRVDAFGQLFEGSKTLLELADKIATPSTVQQCFCGRPANMNLRFDQDGNTVRSGNVIELGDKDRYRSVCRMHWRSVEHIDECFAEDFIF